MQDNAVPRWYSEYHRKRGLVLYDGFHVPKDNLTRSRNQLIAISSLNPVQKQFAGTMVDTEVAAGYFLRNSNVSGSNWTAYVAVKMKYSGDLAHLASIIGRGPPSRGWYANTIKGSLDRRWSLNTQGVVAFALLRAVRPYLYNEKSMIEVDCIMKHGPIVDGKKSHPFITCGAKHIRRGVWYWPQIDDENDGKISTADK
jgi:hypothetical protein